MSRCVRCELLEMELENKKTECERLRELLARQTDETHYWQSKTAKTGRNSG